MVSPDFCSFIQYSSAVVLVTMASVENSFACAARAHSHALERVRVGITCSHAQHQEVNNNTSMMRTLLRTPPDKDEYSR